VDFDELAPFIYQHFNRTKYQHSSYMRRKERSAFTNTTYLSIYWYDNKLLKQ